VFDGPEAQDKEISTMRHKEESGTLHSAQSRTVVSRREFLSSGSAAITAVGASLLTTPTMGQTDTEPQIVWSTSQWKIAAFRKLVEDKAPVKQLFDARAINQGSFLDEIKNSLNALHYGFGVPVDHIKLVGALHGPANLLNFDDYVWDKYQIGAWLQVNDPDTAKPAIKNPFYRSRTSTSPDYNSTDPDNMNSRFQDASIDTLHKRGVQFCCCHTALEQQAKVLVKHNGLSIGSEILVEEMLRHTLPGVLVVASMVSAIALLQLQGHYSYISV
jgi:hypothetical protein